MFSLVRFSEQLSRSPFYRFPNKALALHHNLNLGNITRNIARYNEEKHINLDLLKSLIEKYSNEKNTHIRSGKSDSLHFGKEI